MSAVTPETAALFVGKDPAVQETYRAILAALVEIGAYREEPKKTSIHLATASGFAGIHPRKGALILNLRTEGPIDSPRVVKREQVSRNRWHNEITLSSPGEVDAELIGWLRQAYALA